MCLSKCFWNVAIVSAPTSAGSAIQPPTTLNGKRTFPTPCLKPMTSRISCLQMSKMKGSRQLPVITWTTKTNLKKIPCDITKYLCRVAAYFNRSQQMWLALKRWRKELPIKYPSFQYSLNILQYACHVILSSLPLRVHVHNNYFVTFINSVTLSNKSNTYFL